MVALVLELRPPQLLLASSSKGGGAPFAARQGSDIEEDCVAVFWACIDEGTDLAERYDACLWRE